jgi:hypothetical protein
MKSYRYPWPASAPGRLEMELLHAVRESSSPRVPITGLIADAVASTYGRAPRPAPAQQPQTERKIIMNESTRDPVTDQKNTPDCEACPFRRKAMEDAEKSQTPKGRRRLIDEIRNLDIPARAKAELAALLCSRARVLGCKILRFLKRHRHLGEAAVMGAVVAYLLCHIPLIGGFLALIALGMSVAGGVLRELREELAALFTEDPFCA